MTDFEKLMKYFAGKSYGDLVMLSFELIAIATGFFFVRKQKLGILFLAYLAFDFCMGVGDHYVELSLNFSKQEIVLFVGHTNLLIALAELYIYFYFFSKILQNKKIIRLMKIVAAGFALIIVIFITTRFSFLTERFYYITNIIGVMELLMLIPPCLVYFHELFNNDPSINLYQRPSFWIVTGVFFYAAISVPYYLVDRILTDNRSNYSSVMFLLFFSIPFSVNFIFLTKAFLCRKSLTI